MEVRIAHHPGDQLGGCPADATERRPVALAGALDRDEVHPDEQPLLRMTRRDDLELAAAVLRA
jgi:hypothetical protein